MATKYLTKRQKQYRIARAQTKYKVKFSEKQLKKLGKLKRADTFQKRLSRIAGSIKGGKTTKFLYSKRAYRVLKKRESKLNKQLKKHPEDKSLIKAQLVNTKRLNRLIEKDPDLSPQERETIFFRHKNQEAQLAAAAYGQEEYRPHRHAWFKDEFINAYFASEFYQWKADLEEELMKAERHGEDQRAEEIRDKLSDPYNNYFSEELDQYCEPDKQHSGRLVFRKGDIEEIIYS